MDCSPTAKVQLIVLQLPEGAYGWMRKGELGSLLPADRTLQCSPPAGPVAAAALWGPTEGPTGLEVVVSA